MFEVVAAKESGITSVADLKTREVAVATSTIMDYALDQLLMVNGLTSDDIVKVNIPVMPLRLEALNQGKVASAILTPPLSDLAAVKGGRIIINDIKEPFAGPGLVFSLEALKNKSDATGKFIQAWQEAVELINSNPKKYQEVLNDVALVPEVVKLEVPTFPKLEIPKETAVKSVVNWFSDKGLLTEPIDYKEIVETKYLSR